MRKIRDKLAEKRAAWITRTAQTLTLDETTAAELLRTPRRQSVRLNPLRGDIRITRQELQAAGILGAGFAWCPEGYGLTGTVAALRDHPAILEGRAFIQNAASWLPVIALDAQPGEFVLDICAAPGGKTSHLTARAADQAHMWANDNSRPRLAKLRATMSRLGVHIENYTLYDGQMLTHKLSPQQFDKVLLDAPCSGEGLMNLERDKDFAMWSVSHIKRLQQLQKRLIGQAWQLLKPGGMLVYSTCTMAPEENEAVIDYLLRSRGDAAIVPFTVGLPNRVPALSSWHGKTFDSSLQDCLRLQPSPTIEAFFVCKLQKTLESSVTGQ